MFAHFKERRAPIRARVVAKGIEMFSHVSNVGHVRNRKKNKNYWNGHPETLVDQRQTLLSYHRLSKLQYNEQSKEFDFCSPAKGMQSIWGAEHLLY